MEFALKRNGVYESIEFSGTSEIQTQSKSSNIKLQGKIDDNIYTDYQIIPTKNTITKIELSDDVKLKLISSSPFTYSIPGISPTYYNKSKVDEFLYKIEYGNIDYNYAYEFIDLVLLSEGGCSAIRNGNIFGRNFDWLYDNQVTFVVHTPTSLNRYGVLGVSGIIPGIVKSNVENDDIVVDGVHMFKLLPFYLLDGLNEKGLFCCHNIVPLDDDITPTTEVLPLKEEQVSISIVMLVRYILDNFATAKEAINYLRDYAKITFPETMIEKNYQIHFMIGDYGNSYIVEFIDGKLVVNKKNYMTNFTIDGVTFDTDGTILYPPTSSGINKYGFGLERWNIITQYYKETSKPEAMLNVLDEIKFSNCYGEPFWFSELVRGTDDSGNTITVDTEPSLCTEAVENMRELYATRTRTNPKVWITTHSSIYDIRNKTLDIISQEEDIQYHFVN